MFFIVSVIVWQLPYGNYILYPFTILSTYFHEISHGFAAILLGGDFIKLELFPNGSGLATHTNSYFLPSFGNGLIALAGPLGPTLFGYLLFRLSKNEKYSKFILSVIILFMLLSLVFWVRTLFGVLFLSLTIFVIAFINLKGSNLIQKNTIRAIALQLFLSVYPSLGYFFSEGGVIEGKQFVSDTGVAAKYLLLPYWFWGAFVVVVSCFLFFNALNSIYKTKKDSR